jgi:hypothetical protein
MCTLKTKKLCGYVTSIWIKATMKIKHVQVEIEGPKNKANHTNLI